MKLINAVQYPMTFTGTLTYEDVGNDAAIDVPPGFVLTGMSVAVDEVFDGTLPEVTVTDNMAVPNTLLASTALTAAAVVTAAAGELYNYYPAGARILFALGGDGSTAGSARVLLQGVVHGRQNERVGAA